MIAYLVEKLTPPIALPLVKALYRAVRTRPPAQAKLEGPFLERNRGAAPDEIVLRDGLKLKVHPESRIPYEAFCWRAPEMAVEMDDFIRLIEGKSRLLDIGALHGIFSMVFTAKGGSAVAAEPSPLAYSKLLYNIHANRFGDRVRPFECAITEKPGRLRMYYEWEHAVAAPVEKEVGEVGGNIEAVTGDALCERAGFRPDVVKIDIEGHEVKALRGLRSVMKDLHPLIFLEIHPSRIAAEGDRVEDLVAMLDEAGYRIREANEYKPVRSLLGAQSDVRVVLE